jgi:preprotein translocase subunit YajC
VLGAVAGGSSSSANELSACRPWQACPSWWDLPSEAGFDRRRKVYRRKRKKGALIVTINSLISANLTFALQAQQPGGIALFLPLILIMVIFYFLMILPAQRRQKKVTEMLKALKNGDKVITNGGIYGTIVGLEDDAVQLRVADQVKIKVSRSAIAGLQSEPPKES